MSNKTVLETAKDRVFNLKKIDSAEDERRLLFTLDPGQCHVSTFSGDKKRTS